MNTLAVTDAGSGVDEVVVKIIDPYNRYPTRELHYEGGAFPLAFTWDRHFEDGTLAPYGDYTVLITAADNFGNESSLSAKITVPLIGHIFGGYNTATPMPTLLPTFTPTPRGTAPTLAPTPTAASTELAFGVPVTGAGATGSSAPAAPAQHSSPPSLGFTSFIQNVFFPASGSTVVETSTSSPAQQPLSAASAGVLFGSAAVSATTGLAAYYLQKKKEEEEARRAAILARIAAEKKAAEKQREAYMEQAAQAAAAKLNLYIETMKNTGANEDSINLVRERYKNKGVDAAISLASAAISIQTTVIPYTREKEDPVLENYTGKPSMSMSDALKITNPQHESAATENVMQRDDVCYVPDPKRTDVCYGPTTPPKDTETNWWEKIKKFFSDNVDTGNEGDRNNPKEVFTYSPGGYSPSMGNQVSGVEDGIVSLPSISLNPLDAHEVLDSTNNLVTCPPAVMNYLQSRVVEKAQEAASRRSFDSVMEDATMTSGFDPKTLKYQPDVLDTKIENSLEGGKRKVWSEVDSNFIGNSVDTITGAAGVASVGLQVAGDLTAQTNPELSDNLSGSGELLGAGVDVYDGLEAIISPSSMTTNFLSSMVGKILLPLQAYGGYTTFKDNASRLISDPSIDTNTQGDNVLNERVGVSLQAIGGAAICIGSVAALIVLTGGAAVVPIGLSIIVGCGCLSLAGGTVVENWDWISGKIDSITGKN